MFGCHGSGWMSLVVMVIDGCLWWSFWWIDVLRGHGGGSMCLVVVVAMDLCFRQSNGV